MNGFIKAAALGLLSAVALSGCDDAPATRGPVGQLGLNLQVGDVVLDDAHYEITNPNVALLPAPMAGDIDVTHVPGNMFGAQIGGIPAGTGFTLSLTADSVDGETHCAGSAPFAVSRGVVTSVSLTLQCTGRVTTGSVRADATLNDCPLVSNVTVLPTSVAVGNDIHVFGYGSDQEGDAVTYAWTATGGSFAMAAAADTMYHCTAPGPQTVTLAVSDGDAACPASTLSVPVTCIPVECGNGVVGMAEECEPPGSLTCDTNCQRIAVCGDTFTDAPELCDDGNVVGGDGCSAMCRLEACGNGVADVGEQCDDGNTVSTDACTATCRNAACGDSFVRAGVETCDDGNVVSGDGCSATCSIESPTVCGNGVVEGTEGCDPPGIPVGAQQCSTSCQLVASACVSCQATQCSNFVPFGGVDLVADCYLQTGVAAAGPGAGTERRRLCADLVNCMISSNCADGGAAVSDCFCGAGVEPTPSACAAQGGMCAAQVRAATETISTAEILDRYVDPAYAVGDATRLVQCDQFSCAAACGL